MSASPAEELSVIINISGAGVSDQPWSDDYKQVMTDSRLNTTNICVEVCKQNPDIRLINASAVSAYGFYDDDHEAFSEADTDRRTGTCFLQELIDQWEQATEPAMEAGNRVALLRIGVVFDRSGGGLPAMATPFRYFLGGKSGTGKQIMSWVSLRDLVAAIEFIFDHPDLNGPINIVSPGACSNRVFAQSLGQSAEQTEFCPCTRFLDQSADGATRARAGSDRTARLPEQTAGGRLCLPGSRHRTMPKRNLPPLGICSIPVVSIQFWSQ